MPSGSTTKVCFASRGKLKVTIVSQRSSPTTNNFQHGYVVAFGGYTEKEWTKKHSQGFHFSRSFATNHAIRTVTNQQQNKKTKSCFQARVSLSVFRHSNAKLLFHRPSTEHLARSYVNRIKFCILRKLRIEHHKLHKGKLTNK